MSLKFYETEELEEIAREFLEHHAVWDGEKVDIERTLDRAEYKIFPVLGLKEEFSVEAYLAVKNKTIMVDRYLLDSCHPHLYTTLAEELAHSLIHTNGEPPATVHERILRMSKPTYDRIERDAKHLACAILMPRDCFRAKFEALYAAQKQALGKAGDRSTLVRYTIRRLYMHFNVSFEATAIRARTLGLISGNDLAVLRRYRPNAFE